MIELDDIDTDEDGALLASAELPGGRQITVQYDFDDDFDLAEDDEDETADEDVDPENLPELEEMQSTAERALSRLTAEMLDATEMRIVRELADAAAEDDEEDVDELIEELDDDLVLDGVVVFGDGRMTLLYLAPEQYPDTTIFCLLDDDLDIVDLMVE